MKRAEVVMAMTSIVMELQLRLDTRTNEITALLQNKSEKLPSLIAEYILCSYFRDKINNINDSIMTKLFLLQKEDDNFIMINRISVELSRYQKEILEHFKEAKNKLLDYPQIKEYVETEKPRKLLTEEYIKKLDELTNKDISQVVSSFVDITTEAYEDLKKSLLILKNYQTEKPSSVTRWTKNMDVVMPIDVSSIRGFERWIVWNNAASQLLNGSDRAGFAWAAYINDEGGAVLGLPPGTKIVAIADGRVKKVQHRYLQSYVSYFGGVEIEHDKKGSGLVSTYAYVKPLVIEGQEVKKGDVIATIYSDLLKNSQQSNLPHLDFSLSQKDGKLVDPEKTIYNNVDFLHAEPQNSLDFQIVEKEEFVLVILENEKIKIVDYNIDSLVKKLIVSIEKEGKIEKGFIVANDPYLNLRSDQMAALLAAIKKVSKMLINITMQKNEYLDVNSNL